jgi:hypothetical protein
MSETATYQPLFSGQKVFAVWRNPSTGAVWNGSAYVAWTNAAAIAGCTPMTDQGGELATCAVPSGVSAAGAYLFTVWSYAGSSPVVGDLSSNPVGYGSSAPTNTVVIQGVNVTASSVVSTTYSDMQLNGNQNAPFSTALTYNGFDATGWTQAVFTVKSSTDVADSGSTVQIVISNPTVGGDGLVILNGAAPASPTTASDGSIAVNILYAGTAQAQTTFTITLSPRGMGISESAEYVWALDWFKSSGRQPTIDGGTFSVGASVLDSPVQLSA